MIHKHAKSIVFQKGLISEGANDQRYLYISNFVCLYLGGPISGRAYNHGFAVYVYQCFQLKQATKSHKI